MISKSVPPFCKVCIWLSFHKRFFINWKKHYKKWHPLWITDLEK